VGGARERLQLAAAATSTYRRCWSELTRQVTVGCAERGALMRRLALLERQIEVERGVASAAQVVELEARLTFDEAKRHKELDAWRARYDAKAAEVEEVLGRESEVTKANERLEVMMRRYQEQRKEAQVGSIQNHVGSMLGEDNHVWGVRLKGLLLIRVRNVRVTST
jgi:uncharacterized membrane protein YqiK